MLGIKKIITHDGVFHADEVIAAALLRVQGWDCEVVRTRDKDVLSQALLDLETLVLDQGGEYNIDMLNLDHHQDPNLPSVAGLVWRHFNAYILSDLAKTYFDEFISGIDKWDTNRDGCHADWPKEFRNLSHIIAGFNRDPFDSVNQDIQFEKAVKFAIVVVENEKNSALLKARAEIDYSAHVVINGVAIFSQFSQIWRDKGEYEFAVMPHPSGWQVVAAKIVNKVIPETAKDFEGFIFRHNTGFMATFDTLENIIKFIETI
jgi:uncharacterized UPF0160 family protein